CLYSPDKRMMIAGDHMLEFITPHIGWLPERDALGDFRRSLDRVYRYEVDLILPGHGTPFARHREWISATLRHHDVRCERIVASLGEGPRTAHQLVSDLWARPLAPFHHRFAVFEVLAHLEFLRRRERVRLEQQNGHQVWLA